MLEQVLLPDVSCLKLDACSIDAAMLILSVSTTQPQAICPSCETTSQRVHSYYQRKPADLPCCGHGVRLDLTTRRFFCGNPDCDKATFTERMPTVIAPYARRTRRLREVQQSVGFEVGGEQGARLLNHLRMEISGDTLLRLIPREAPVNHEAPRVLGVDDWALRKGHVYGTILVDLETHTVVDLLEERSAEVLAAWLESHPGVEIISRDRSGEYGRGASAGAPQAVQVADRFHLLQNLVDALKRIFEHQATDLRAAAQQMLSTSPALSESTEGCVSPPPASDLPQTKPLCEQSTEHSEMEMNTEPSPTSSHQAKSQAELRFDEVKTLLRQGLNKRTIARRLNIDRRTVSRYAAFETYPERASSAQSTSKALAYLPYLRKRWHEGCHNAQVLFAEMQADGFDGSYATVWRLVRRHLAANTRETTAKPSRTIIKPLSSRQAAWLLMRNADELDENEQLTQKVLLDVSNVAATAYPMVQAFRQMINQRQLTALDPWLAQAEACDILELRRFASSLQRDKEAVRAALTYSWSNGQVEGHIHRLKLIKRQMYGRASFGLLRSRVLGPPHAMSEAL